MDYLEIIDLLSKKDKRGLELLYTLYGGKFFSFAVEKWDLSEDEAWDVVYQTLETLILKLSQYEFESKKHFENFIFKVFTNFLRQYFRSSRKKESYIYFEYINQDVPADNKYSLNEQAEIEIDKKDFDDYYKYEDIENPKLIALQNALKKLSELDRELLLLRAQNFTYDEIAEFLKIDNNQLKVRHYRAIQKLMKFMSI